MPLKRFVGKFRSSSTRSMTTAFASWTLTNDQTSNVPGNPPGSSFMQSLHMEVSSISSATQLIVKVTRDSAGDFAITPIATGSLTTGQGTATNGSCVLSVADVPTPAGYNTVYVWVRTNAGTATGTTAILTTEPSAE